MTVEDSVKVGKETLAHYGIKGMRWGVRRDNPSAETTEVGLHTDPATGRIYKTTGGANRPTSEDAQRVMVSKQIAKTSGVHALSNLELQQAITRMNLEQQYSNLSTQKSTVFSGQAKVKQILGVAKTIQEVHGLLTSPLGKAVRTALG